MLDVLRLWHMSRTLTIRLTEELAEWLLDKARKTGEPAGRIIRRELERARMEGGQQRFLRHAGQIDGPADLSMRKGFSRR
jgi:hypothetical protein